MARLLRIRQNTKQGKAYQQAVDARSLIDYAEFIPFGLAGQAARLYTRMNMADRHRPLFNVVITNVPGPQRPLYMAGKKLLAHMGMAPIFDGMGLILPIFSYNGILSISPTSAQNVLPDVDLFTRYLWESANELEAQVLSMYGGEVEAKRDDPLQCEAMTRAGERCRNRRMEGLTVCHVHR
jgi:hypothetical protein